MNTQPLIQFRNITKKFDTQIVLKGLNLDIYENEFVTLLGPSGCGKTTLLRILGGFLDADEGSIIFDGEDIQKLPPYKRELNTVFQKYALFPHMNVFDNIAFGLKLKKLSKDVIEQKVMRMLKLIGLEGFETREVSKLSGGQQQRIAIARALVNEPKVLLLDEPLGALDLKLRKEMQRELKNIQKEVGITFIYVTHDQEEALTMSDKIVVMNKGLIYQVASPEDIYNTPQNKYVASFIGESNIRTGRMLEDYKLEMDEQIFECLDHGFAIDELVDVVIRPEDINLVDPANSKMQGTVQDIFFKGMHYDITVQTIEGTSVTVNMHVIAEHDVVSEDGSEKISANDFYVDIEDLEELDEKEIVARADAKAWEVESDEYISIHRISHEIENAIGSYEVTFETNKGTAVTRKVHVVDQRYTSNKKADEAIMAFDFYKTIDEIDESVTFDTNLKTWAGVQGWRLSNEDEEIDVFVDYDFDPNDIHLGTYKVTFSSKGVRYRINTTQSAEIGDEVGLDFAKEAIHVMHKMTF